MGCENNSLFIPLIVAVIAAALTAFFTYLFSQEAIKENKIKEIKNNIVYTCDKLITYAIQAEMNQFAFRLHEHLYTKSKNPSDEYEYRLFHDKALNSVLRFKLLKSKMNKHLHELFIYDKNTAEKLAGLFNKANNYEIRGFAFTFDDENNVLNYNNLFEEIKDHILYKSDLGKSLKEIMCILGLNIVKPKAAPNN